MRLLSLFVMTILLTLPGLATAMDELEDNDLATVTGQAIFKIQDFKNYRQYSGGTLDFTRLTLGAKIEINMNIQEVKLGTYARPAGINCREGGRFCYSPDGWNCSSNPCGLDTTNAANTMPDSDIAIRELTLGTVNDSNGQLTDFVVENPFLEFAFDGTGANRKFVGMRIGYMKANGTMGNIIDVLSGAIAPAVDANLFGGIPVGRLPMMGARNKGYIDGFFEPGMVNTLGKSGPQLSDTRTVELSNARDFFLSVANRRVDYPATSPGVGASPTAGPGFWMNIMDGLNAKAELSGAGPKPDNYLPGHVFM